MKQPSLKPRALDQGKTFFALLGPTVCSQPLVSSHMDALALTFGPLLAFWVRWGGTGRGRMPWR